MKRRQWAVAGLVLLGLASMGSLAMAEEAKVEKAPGDMIDVYRTIGLAAAAAFVTAVSVVGAGYAVGRIGSAALGAAAEKPELLTRSLPFVALAEGLAVLGFAIAMMLLQKI
jgi:V/A-type H+-transporting ATPase subunit K